MRFTKFAMLLASFCIVSLLTIGAVHPVKPGPVPAPAISPPCADDMDSIESCPASGCGEFGDALLNAAKNKAPNITSGTPKKLDDIRAMSQPATWNTGKVRTIPEQVGEGKAVEVKGFLLRVKAEGGESCNCGLTRRVDTDVHFALTDDGEDPESTSITAEITPRVRRNGHSEWVFKNLNDFEGEYVKVVGLLMLDTKHIPQAAPLPGERRNKGLVRATNWEIHPITRLFRCTKSKHACDHGHGWEEIH